MQPAPHSKPPNHSSRTHIHSRKLSILANQLNEPDKRSSVHQALQKLASARALGNEIVELGGGNRSSSSSSPATKFESMTRRHSALARAKTLPTDRSRRGRTYIYMRESRVESAPRLSPGVVSRPVRVCRALVANNAAAPF